MIAGIDFSSHGCDVVSLNLDDDNACWTHYDFAGRDALARVRSVRDSLPARGAWADSGVVMIVLERPMSRSPHGLVPLMRTLGAIHACLPTGVDVREMTAVEWRLELGFPHNEKRLAAKARSVAFASERWTNLPPAVSGDAADAFALAYAARQMCERAAAA